MNEDSNVDEGGYMGWGSYAVRTAMWMRAAMRVRTAMWMRVARTAMWMRVAMGVRA